MPKLKSWIVTAGVAAAAPGAAFAGPFGLSLPWGGDKADAAAPAAAATETPRTNQAVAEQIAGALRAAGVSGTAINIEYIGGVATLTGGVSSPAVKQLAGGVVARVPGVTSVANGLTVEAAARVAPIAAAAPAGAPSGVTTADATDANPFAFGEIEQVAARQFAARRKSVERPKPTRANNPFARPAAPATPPAFTAQAAPPAPSNQQVAKAIGTALRGAGLAGYEMEVSFQDGVCVLGGTIADPRQAAAAQAVASRVPGVRQVTNNLTVKPVQTAAASGNPYAGGSVTPTALAAPAGALAAAAGAPMVPPGKMMGDAAYGPIPTAPVAGGPVYNNPGLPPYAYPTQSQYPNYASVSYPQQYSASAWPYIGPFYPYPQVPLGWREVTLEWDDGQWYLDFNDRTDRWWWFLSPKNW